MARTTIKINQVRFRRRNRVRARLRGTAAVPRLSIFRSNRSIAAQLIDDALGVTIAQAHSKHLAGKTRQTKLEDARAVGSLIALQAKEAKVPTVVFDRGQYRYHGRVKALADAARADGLHF